MGMGPGGGFSVSEADIKQLQNMFQDFGKMMGGPAGNSGSGNKAAPDATAGAMHVPVDVAEEADAYTFTADLPGVSRADTKVQANKEQRTLTVSGRRAAPQLSDEQKQRRSRTERRFGTFQRVFKLPEDADAGGITARFKDGVLSVRVKRTKPAEPQVNDVPIDDWFSGSTQA